MRELRIALVGVALLTGCGGKKISWDEAEVQLYLDRVVGNVLHCEAMGPAGPAARTLPDLERADGSCGGTLLGTSEHENGITDYVVTFERFCVSSDEGDVVVDGTFLAKQIGTPSDSGPVISRAEVETDGPVTIENPDGSVLALEIEGAVDYGYPEAWTPGIPDDANPDVGRIRSGTLTLDDGTVMFVEDVEIVRTGGLVATMEITGGRMGTEGEGTADIRTREGDPLVMETLVLTGGTVDFEGAGGTVASIAPSPETAGVFVLELDGAELPTQLDCSAGVAPLLEAGLALLTELPL